MFKSFESLKSALPYFLDADRTTLLKLYQKLDYGCIIYGSALKLYLQMLDPVHKHVF